MSDEYKPIDIAKIDIDGDERFKLTDTDLGTVEYRGDVEFNGSITVNKDGEVRLAGKNPFEGLTYTGKDSFLSEET